MAQKNTRIMFVCKANSTRSQMAEGFARVQTAGRPFTIASSGLKSTAVNPKAVDFMKEVGIDISDQKSEALADFNPVDFDVVISLCGCGVNLPSEWAFKGSPGKVFEDWSLTDPVGQPDTVYVEVRDRIKARVARLLDMLEGKVAVSESAVQFLKEDLADNHGKVVIVSRTTCPYCTKAKELLKGIPGFDYSVNVHTIEVNLRTDEDDLLEAVKQLVGARSTPQIWVAGKHVGGCDALVQLHESQQLEGMLKEAGLL